MWMDGMTLFIARSWPLTLNPFIILREQSIILYHTTVPKFVRYQNRSTSPSGNYVHLQSHFDRYLTKEGTDISIVQQTGPLKLNLSGWDDSSLNVIDPPHSTLEICAGNIRPMNTWLTRIYLLKIAWELLLVHCLCWACTKCVIKRICREGGGVESNVRFV